MMTPRMAGLIWAQLVSSLVTEMKSEPRNTPLTPEMANRPVASGRGGGGFHIAEVARLADENVAAGQEFQGCRIGRGFGLNEHGDFLGRSRQMVLERF